MKKKITEIMCGVLVLIIFAGLVAVITYKYLNEPMPEYEPQTEQAVVEEVYVDPVETSEPVEIPEKNLTQEEKDLIARLLYFEARGESLECQIKVVEVILNRVDDLRFPDTVEEVIYAPGQFSPVGCAEWNIINPPEEFYEAVETALVTENDPDTMLYFAGGRYHRFGNLVDYKQVDNTYFSISE